MIQSRDNASLDQSDGKVTKSGQILDMSFWRSHHDFVWDWI